MITPEQRVQIRRLYFAEHWKIGTIAAELGLHRDAVRHALEPQRFTNRRYTPSAPLIEPYQLFIEQTLEQYPRLRSTRLYEMLVDRGYKGSVCALRRHVAKVRPASRHEAFFKLNTLPGEQAQVDWGSFGKLRIGCGVRNLSCFVLVLAWSRATFARFTLDQTLESFLRCHAAAFEALRGVPRSILYDNLKSVVLERQGDLVRFNPQILELAGHYHFAPKPVGVARGNEKGRVEKRIRDLRESFFAAREFLTLDDLNRQLDEWIRRVVNARLVPGDTSRTVEQALTEERERLLPLPEHALRMTTRAPPAQASIPIFASTETTIQFLTRSSESLSLWLRPIPRCEYSTATPRLPTIVDRGTPANKSRARLTCKGLPTKSAKHASIAVAIDSTPPAPTPPNSSGTWLCMVGTSVEPLVACCACSISMVARNSTRLLQSRRVVVLSTPNQSHTYSTSGVAPVGHRSPFRLYCPMTLGSEI